MDRKVKYRIWDKHLLKFIYDVDFLSGGYWSCNGSPVFIYEGEPENYSNCEAAFEDNFVLQEYTGVKDSYGVDIYEGDIIYSNNKLHAEVVYDCRFGQYKLAAANSLSFYLERFYKLSVIGNIFEGAH